MYTPYIVDTATLCAAALFVTGLRIIVNPPFGSTINKAEKPYLANYELDD